MKTNRIIPRLPRKMVEDYRASLYNYIRSMTYYKKMLDDELISVEEYSEIELTLLKKYQLSPKKPSKNGFEEHCRKRCLEQKRGLILFFYYFI